MAPSDFAKAHINEIVDQLTTDEAILLTAGVGFWHTHAIPRLGVPAIKVSDGPNGIRGNHFFMSTPAKCLPCATALGSTWDTQLIEEMGLKLMAGEAKLRAASIVLAPTCNIQRNPLGGRSFESFSEDPFLSGMIAASYTKGVQSGGIGICIKHFVCNDKEVDRFAYDSVVSPRAMREIYLMPFMLAQKFSQPWAYMTAYNRVNGTHCSENPHILQDILRKEWAFDGMVMSDWFGTYGVDGALNAGLDLEMPGTGKWRTTELVTRTIGSRKVTLRTVKERARRVLQLAQRCAAGAPEVLDGDGEERTKESEEDTALMRRLAAESIVLLKNENDLLPLRPKEQGLKKIAVLGGNAKAFVISGGGSASLKPSYFVSPYDGITRMTEAEGVEFTYGEGAVAYKTMPSLDFELVTADSKRGWMAEWFAHESDTSMTPVAKPMAERHVDETCVFISTSTPPGITRRWTMQLKGSLKPRTRDCTFEFGLTVNGRAKLYVDDKLVLDNWTRQRRGNSFFECGSVEERGTCELRAGVAHAVRVEFCNVRGPADTDPDEVCVDFNAGMRLGGAEMSNADTMMEEAVQLAKDADAAIVVVGLNADWETEGYDRTTLALAGRTDELVHKVLAANPRTIIVTQSGSAVTMPWVEQAHAVVHSWYLGNATGDAIADVLFGRVNPSAKLSITFPKRIEDVPSYSQFNSENGVVRYGEDLFVGYKHYQHRKIEPLWPFGHGLTYTKFEYSDLHLTKPTVSAGSGDFDLTATLTVKNVGAVAGTEVVQLYVTVPSVADPAPAQVPLALRAFAKVRELAPGASAQVTLRLDKYAVSQWDERIKRWVVEPGSYRVQVGPSSATLPLQDAFEVVRGFEWNGL